MFDEVKRILLCRGLQISPEKYEEEYLGCEISLQTMPLQNIKIRREQLQTLSDLQISLGDTN